jgi:hypothetical protein
MVLFLRKGPARRLDDPRTHEGRYWLDPASLSRELFTSFVWLFGGHSVDALFTAALLAYWISTRTDASNPLKAQELIPLARYLVC